jgi:hypothetical protein
MLTTDAWRLKMESIDQWSQIPITLMRSTIWVRIKVKSWIRIRIKVMRIRKPEEKSGKEKGRYLQYEGETSERTEKNRNE